MNYCIVYDDSDKFHSAKRYRVTVNSYQLAVKIQRLISRGCIIVEVIRAP